MRAPDDPNRRAVATPAREAGTPVLESASPERLDSWKEIAAFLGRSVLTAQRWEKNEGLPVHRHVHERQASVYAFRSELDLWRRARDVAPSSEDGGGKTSADAAPERPSSLSGVLQVGMFLLLAIVVALTLVIGRYAAKVRWARQEALPRIERLVAPGFSTDNYLVAYRLAADAERYVPSDTQLVKSWRTISRKIDVVTEPPGAEFSIGGFAVSDTVRFGAAPLRRIRVPRGFLRWRLRKDGYEPSEGILEGWIDTLHVVLTRTESVPPGMVRAAGGKFELAMAHLGEQPLFELTDYWIDRYEVTNREFKVFVDAAGYTKQEHWKERFIQGDRELSFAEAMHLFRDRTGRPGPATWSAGDFPEGKGDYPVVGVSWFEAMAYADFVGKKLPTIFHWARAASIWENSEVVPRSNFGNAGLAPIRSNGGMSAVGAYDMAGNAKEWCFNASRSARFILGGAWNEPVYMFGEADAQLPFSRADNFGFRLVKYISPPPRAMLAAVDYPRRDFTTEAPATDAAFRVIRGLYSYDNSPLHSAVEFVSDSNEHWRKEIVSFDAAYGGERVTALVFIPRHARPPYQTVIYFPGSNAITDRSSRGVQPPWNGAIVASGRALVIPIMKGTYERGDALQTDYPTRTDYYREHVLDWYKDLGRTLDYIATRPDLDSARIAYAGFSWGARLGPIFLALDPRFKAAALVAGGLKFARTFPEADPFNFVSRVRIPVLMVNGRYDYFFPLETSQQPLLDQLGTRARDKRHVVLNSGHSPPTTAAVTAMLDWYDQYLGPARAP